MNPHPDMTVTPEAKAHVHETVATWGGDARDLALALVAYGNAILWMIDGRTDHIELYRSAAQAIMEHNPKRRLDG